MSCEFWWHSQQRTFRQEVGSFLINARNLGGEGGEEGVGEGGVGRDGVGGISEVGDIGCVGDADRDRDGWRVPEGEGTVVGGVGSVGGDWDGEGGAQERGENCSSFSSSSPLNSSTSHPPIMFCRWRSFLGRLARDDSTRGADVAAGAALALVSQAVAPE